MRPMLIDRIAGQTGRTARPAPRVVVTRRRGDAHRGACRRPLTLFGLWGDAETVHMALLLEEAAIRVVTLACPAAQVPLGRPCIRPRFASNAQPRDLWGIEPVGLPDDRPWLDHGRWGVQASARRPDRGAFGSTTLPPFFPAEGESLHQIPVGPCHAGIIEPGHFRFTANGETVVRLEERLGYVHKGIERLMAGRSIETSGAARRAHLGRQHGRLCASPSRGGRGGARGRRSAARALSARADGRARTARQSFRRHRRDLQRRLLRH